MTEPVEQDVSAARSDAIGADDHVRLDRLAAVKVQRVDSIGASNVDESMSGKELSRIQRISEDVQQLRSRDFVMPVEWTDRWIGHRHQLLARLVMPVKEVVLAQIRL